MRLGQGAISNLAEVTYNTGMNSTSLIAFFNSYGQNHPVVQVLDSKRNFAIHAWNKLNGTEDLPDAINQILSPHFWPIPDERERQIDLITRCLKSDKLAVEDVDGSIVIAPIGKNINLGHLKNHGSLISHSNLLSRITLIERTLEDSPTDAIGLSKELIEAVTKDLLEKLDLPLPAKSNPSSLVKAVLKGLSIAPDDIDHKTRGTAAIKATLNSLIGIAHQLDELRAMYGSGHGKSSSAKGLEPRHARMAVGAASTVCVFLVETFEKQK